MVHTVKQRRLEAKTDYKARLALLKSGKPRLVIRKTNKRIIAQIVESQISQDRIILGVHSGMLLSKGWPKEKEGSLKSKPSCYLTGFMLGNAAKSKINGEVILDIGMHRNIKKSRIYAVLKGAIDAGLKIPHKDIALPTEESLSKNKNHGGIFDKLKKNI